MEALNEPSDSNPIVALSLTAQEMASTVEALHDAIVFRLRWCQPHGRWRQLPLDTVQVVIDSMVDAYSKMTMALREVPTTSQEFLKMIELSDHQWELISRISLAEDWSEVP